MPCSAEQRGKHKKERTDSSLSEDPTVRDVKQDPAKPEGKKLTGTSPR